MATGALANRSANPSRSPAARARAREKVPHRQRDQPAPAAASPAGARRHGGNAARFAMSVTPGPRGNGTAAAVSPRAAPRTWSRQRARRAGRNRWSRRLAGRPTPPCPRWRPPRAGSRSTTRARDRTSEHHTAPARIAPVSAADRQHTEQRERRHDARPHHRRLGAGQHDEERPWRVRARPRPPRAEAATPAPSTGRGPSRRSRPMTTRGVRDRSPGSRARPGVELGRVAQRETSSSPASARGNSRSIERLTNARKTAPLARTGSRGAHAFDAVAVQLDRHALCARATANPGSSGRRITPGRQPVPAHQPGGSSSAPATAIREAAAPPATRPRRQRRVPAERARLRVGMEHADDLTRRGARRASNDPSSHAAWAPAHPAPSATTPTSTRDSTATRRPVAVDPGAARGHGGG